ncbi:succinylglutamate desuccinylase [Terasakiispira papahanaumokuakeensis]|uniref:Succinylglutamate desuccinylase n=1 Tax=Terasakiispira papahanaumokuakeensis TaxID=197479 RepID=A0A1E2V7I1_9GAMM|nr:succinylglutamate desuccinylase [Terasakiispira papahanaumokuakeensis]ODC02812.1 succinylglutamate desuccinylase [Terasakiispira papahanaumokuakeensis]
MIWPNKDLLQFTLENPTLLEDFPIAMDSGSARYLGPGILQFEPESTPLHSVILSAGIHGNETAPIELINQLINRIVDGTTTLNVRLLVIFGHPEAMIAQQRFCEVNLNRLFNGQWQHYKGQETERARFIEEKVEDFFVSHGHGQKLHYDLHTAIRGSQFEKFAIHPFTHSAAYPKEQFAFLKAIGLEAVLLSHEPASTFSYHTYKNHSAQSATVELGAVRPFGENDLSKLEDLFEALIQLLTDGSLAQSDEEIKLFQVVDTLIKDAEDYQLNISSDTPNFTSFKAGKTLAHSSQSHYTIKQDGDALVFPNTNLPIGQRAGLVVRATDWRSITLE